MRFDQNGGLMKNQYPATVIDMKMRQPMLLMYSDNLKFIKKDNVIKLAKLRKEVCPEDEIVLKPLR